MSSFENDTSKSVPSSVQFLFDNNSLDVVKTTVLLHSFSLKSSKRYIKVSEVAFYYSLVNFDLIKLFDANKESEKQISANQFFRFQFKLREIILWLYELALIEVKGSVRVKTEDIGIRLTSSGISFIEELTSEYFVKLAERYSNALASVEFSIANLKILKGGRNNESNDI